MMSTMQSDKSALRKRLLEARHKIAFEERCEIENRIFQHVMMLKAYQQAQTVFLYCSADEEIGTHRLLKNALAAGKRVCVPLCTDKKGVMEPRVIKRVSQLSLGRFGILEPPADAAPVLPEEIDLCIVPCLSADASGHRLGYGGGYYDRFLAGTTSKTIVLCAERFFTQALPAEPHDCICSMIVTERQVHIAE